MNILKDLVVFCFVITLIALIEMSKSFDKHL